MRYFRPVIDTCFCFFNCQNCSARAAMLATIQASYIHVFLFSACKNYNMGIAIPIAGQANCTYMFYFSAYKNCITGVVILAISLPTVVSCQLHIPVFAFLIVKICNNGGSSWRYVRPVACTYFCFSAYNNHNIGVVAEGMSS